MRASPTRRLCLAGLMMVGLCGPGFAQTSDLVSQSAFRVCADPALLPFSNKAGEGFENRIAELFAADLGLPVHYEWYPMATGFIRKTLTENLCDVVIGYAQGEELVLNTNHYMTSTHVLVTRPDSELASVDRLDDPRLKGKRIGVIAGSPPASHLARNGLLTTTRGYQLVADSRYDSPNGQMVADLLAGDLDVAVLWGPIGGPMAKTKGLNAVPLLKEPPQPRLFYRITMGVRQGDLVWKRKLNSMIRKKQAEIDTILREAGVPLLTENGTALKPAP